MNVLAAVLIASLTYAGSGKELFPPKTPIKELTTRPEAPQNLEPAPFTNTGTTSVVLKWGLVEGADQYHLQVATDPNFKWLIYNGEFEKTNSYPLSGLEAKKTYYWRVWAKKTKNDPTYTKSLSYSRSVFSTN